MTINKPDKKILHHLYVKKELSSNDIAKIYNCSGTTVKKWMKDYNIRPRTHKENGIRMWKDPLKRKKIIAAQLDGWENPAAHENASKAQKKRNKDYPQCLSEIGTYPELEGIDDEATFEQFGYYSTQLSEKSGRLITRICKICGRSKNIQKHAYSVLCQRCATQTEEFCKMRSEIATEQFSTEEGREKDRQGAIKRWEDPEEHIKASIYNKAAQGTSEARKVNSERGLQYHKDHPERAEQHGIYLKEYYINNPEERERRSAENQGQNYPDEWTGFTDHGRSHLIPQFRCLQLNPWFEGCVRHHITTGVIIHIPTDLHKSIWHQMPNGDRKDKNMKEINKLAFKYLLGKL